MSSNNETVVVDQMKYGTIITAQGAAIIADCILTGKKLPVVEAAAGDGGGSPVVPDLNQTALVNERWRGSIVRAEPSTVTANMIDVKIVIGEEVGSFVIREMGLFSGEGVLIAVCNTPDTEKVPISEGVSGKLTMIMHIIVADTSVLEFTITPALDTVSRPEMESAIADALCEIDPVTGMGEPESTTPGQVGQKYEDTASGDTYTCTAVTQGESGATPHYLWVPGKLGTLAEIRTAYSNTRGQLSNPNLFYNSYWAAKDRIINQRGKLTYTENGYTIDGLGLTNATLTILEKGIELKANAGKQIFFAKKAEGFWLFGHTVTCSVLFGDGTLRTWTIPLKKPDTLPTTRVNLYSTGQSGYTLEIWAYVNPDYLLFQISTWTTDVTTVALAAKLELGPVQTLAHKEGGTWVLNDPPPDPALELLKSKRYLQPIVVHNWRCVDKYVSANGEFVLSFESCMFPVEMQAKPTLINPEDIWISYQSYNTWYKPLSVGYGCTKYSFILSITVEEAIYNSIDKFFAWSGKIAGVSSPIWFSSEP